MQLEVDLVCMYVHALVGPELASAFCAIGKAALMHRLTWAEAQRPLKLRGLPMFRLIDSSRAAPPL